jgi:NAD-dependent deacetylase
MNARAVAMFFMHELLKVQYKESNYILDWKTIWFWRCGSENNQLRPHIVWFGEEVPRGSKVPNLTACWLFCGDWYLLLKYILQLVYLISKLNAFYLYYPKPIKIPNLKNTLHLIPQTSLKGMKSWKAASWADLKNNPFRIYLKVYICAFQ